MATIETVRANIESIRAVIAVFGANKSAVDGSRAAELLGAAVNRSGAVLLTGSEPPAGGFTPSPMMPVKDAAIYGADNDDSSARPPAWIGVANHRQAAPASIRGPASVVLTPGWGDRRNLVEACLCDAAIAVVEPDVENGQDDRISDGTASEALFTLYLGRPLVVVGSRLSGMDLSLKALRTLAGKRVVPAGSDLAVDRGIAGAYEWAETSDIVLATAPLPLDEAAATRIVVDLLGQVTARSPRSTPLDLDDKDGWDGYVKAALRASGR